MSHEVSAFPFMRNFLLIAIATGDIRHKARQQAAKCPESNYQIPALTAVMRRLY